jgi:hypothetical protein
LTILLPPLIGVIYACSSVIREFHKSHIDQQYLLRLSILGFVITSWSWYITLSIGSPRYAFPPVFVSMIFLGALLSDTTNGLQLQTTANRLTGLFRRPRPNGAIAALLAVLIFACAAPLTLLSLSIYYTTRLDQATERVAIYINQNTPTTAIIETYDTELYPLLDRRYHYPPDQLHVDLIKITSLDQNLAINYDPLTANPDYLVIGVWAWQSTL